MLTHNVVQSGGSEGQQPVVTDKTAEEPFSTFWLRNWCLGSGRLGMCQLCAVFETLKMNTIVSSRAYCKKMGFSMIIIEKAVLAWTKSKIYACHQLSPGSQIAPKFNNE